MARSNADLLKSGISHNTANGSASQQSSGNNYEWGREYGTVITTNKSS